MVGDWNTLILLPIGLFRTENSKMNNISHNQHSLFLKKVQNLHCFHVPGSVGGDSTFRSLFLAVEMTLH